MKFMGIGQGVDISSGFSYDQSAVPLASLSQTLPVNNPLTTTDLLGAGFEPSQIGAGETITGGAPASSSTVSTATIGLIAVAGVAVLLLMGVGRR